MNGFLTELLTQGEVLREVADFYRGEGKRLMEAAAGAFRSKGLDKVALTGMGSSLYSTEVIRGFLSARGIPCVAFSSDELDRFEFGLIDKRTLVVAVSASGNSKEVVRLVEKAKRITTVAGIFNNEDSKLAELCDLPLPIRAGIETSVTNKTYEVSMMILNILGRYLTGTYCEEFEKDLDRTIDWVRGWCGNWEEPSGKMAAFAGGVSCFDLLANGPSRAASRQICLAYRESLHNATSEWELADFAHGHYHSCKQGAAYLAQIFEPELLEGTQDLRMFNFILDHGGRIMVYSSKDVPRRPNVYTVELPAVADTLLPLSEAVAAETMLGALLVEDWVKN